VTAVHVVVPAGIDDPAHPSGGNAYDRRVCRGLQRLGWSVREHAVPGSWPQPDALAYAALAEVMGCMPDGSLVLIDGLLASTAPAVLVPEARRLGVVVLVHMPLGHRPADGAADEIRRRERAVLEASVAVVTTSRWSRGRLLELYELAPERLHVAEPGVDPAEPADGTPAGGQLLCVASVAFEKGHDVLVEALLSIAELSWRCVCVGDLDRDPDFVADLRRRATAGGLGGRVDFPGPGAGSELARSYATADLLVLASRAETYGMVVTEALAHGLPVVASDVGGVAEALGRGGSGVRPGLLVTPESSQALAAALRSWLGEVELRHRLRRAARERRKSLPAWSTTTAALAGVLAGARR
jgi:glycosyltransferase involved in cell wall biosynthesis